MRIGIDVGGTFTDFLLMLDDNTSEIYKTLSTPDDPSVATLQGIEEMARAHGASPEDFLKDVDLIVHGTTVTTNAVLTRTGAKTALLTTRGVRDALEMRRGIREEQYNNLYKNVEPLAERYLRHPVAERIGSAGEVVRPIDPTTVAKGVERFRQEDVEAVAVCFMNAFANSSHERVAARAVRETLPGAYLTVSSEFLPSIRFYDRVSTVVLNSYVGPILARYLDALRARLARVDYGGVLLIMQSNGGVTSPEVARPAAASTLLSGPAGGPVAGVTYADGQGYDDCITMDMGGTSFDAALMKNREPFVTTAGEIDRLRLALPMLNVVTIGAGGGSIGWIDEGGLLRMGPRSAGAKPGPACYGLGGEHPTCTDADLVLGYLDPGFFAGGRMKLSRK
ncbi:MAG: hydantoinase/oxoprolinase family protein, partial [Planctomycetota bacterium]